MLVLINNMLPVMLTLLFSIKDQVSMFYKSSHSFSIYILDSIPASCNRGCVINPEQKSPPPSSLTVKGEGAAPQSGET